MTVCIGAISRASQRYVCVTDLFLTQGEAVSYEADFIKARFAANGWIGAFAGSCSNWLEVQDWLRLNEPKGLLSLSEAEAFFTEAYEHERLRATFSIAKGNSV
jgi:hypothetical protein